MKISASECKLKEVGNIPNRFDLTKTLEEFKVQFVDFEDTKEQEFYENDIDTVVIFCPKEIDSWAFFKAVYSLKPDGFLYYHSDNGNIVYLSWYGNEEEF